MFKVLFFALLIGVTLYPTNAWQCNPSNVNCTSANTYQLCLQIGSVGQLIDVTINCPTGTVCDDSLSSPCVESTTTTTPPPTTVSTTTSSCTTSPITTTTPSTTTSPTTTTMPSTTTSPTTTTTPSTTTSPTTITTPSTTTSPTTTTTPSTTTSPTTTTPAPAPEECTESITWAAEKCNEYYECVKVLWYYEKVLRKCAANEAYNGTACAPSATCA